MEIPHNFISSGRFFEEIFGDGPRPFGSRGHLHRGAAVAHVHRAIGGHGKTARSSVERRIGATLLGSVRTLHQPDLEIIWNYGVESNLIGFDGV